MTGTLCWQWFWQSCWCCYGNSIPNSRPSPEIRASPAPSPSSPEPRKSNSLRASSESSSSSSSSGSRSVVMGSELIWAGTRQRMTSPHFSVIVNTLQIIFLSISSLIRPLHETFYSFVDRRCSRWLCLGSHRPRRCHLHHRLHNHEGKGSCPTQSHRHVPLSFLCLRSYRQKHTFERSASIFHQNIHTNSHLNYWSFHHIKGMFIHS